MAKPAELRSAEIASVIRSGEDKATVRLANGNELELDLDELVKDWLHLHRKLQHTKAWATQVKAQV